MDEKSKHLSSIHEEWKEINTLFSQLEVLQKSCSQSVTDFKKAENEYKKAILQHSKSINKFFSTLERCDAGEEWRQRVSARKEELRSMMASLPNDNGLYLRIVLGDVNVTLLDQEEKYKYKDEYERFKLVVTSFVLALSFLNIITTYKTLDAILHFLLVWYYCTLTIRESILVVNGSRIKGWWRAHHFITTVLVGVLILWHDGESYQLFRKQFMWYSCYSSFLQFLQYHYQQGCLYRLRALGERHNMDITIDGFHSWMWRGLKFLLPFLMIGYIWQLHSAYTLYRLTLTVRDIEWQVPVASVLFFVLFTGNSLTTALILHQKINLKDLLRRRKIH